jgi:hypothetical protein
MEQNAGLTGRTRLVDDECMSIPFEHGESASNEAKRYHDESTKRMTTPKDMEHLWDAKLCDALCETEIGARQGTLCPGGDVAAILTRGDARGEPSAIDGAG